jgi:hypothetical protein
MPQVSKCKQASWRSDGSNKQDNTDTSVTDVTLRLLQLTVYYKHCSLKDRATVARLTMSLRMHSTAKESNAKQLCAAQSTMHCCIQQSVLYSHF